MLLLIYDTNTEPPICLNFEVVVLDSQQRATLMVRELPRV